jgi:hypothetical protein
MQWKVRAHSVHTPLHKVQTSCDCAYIPYVALTHFCERKVEHSTGQIFEYKWTMGIRIDSTELSGMDMEEHDKEEDEIPEPPDSSLL